MTFVSYFDNYKFILTYLVQILGFSIFMFVFKLRKIQIISTKYPKHVIKLLGHILRYYTKGAKCQDIMGPCGASVDQMTW